MINMSAKFDEDAQKGLFSIMFTMSKSDVQMDWHTARCIVWGK